MDQLLKGQYLPLNEAGRDFFVGDIHGECSQLFALLEKVGFDYSSDRLFSVGDLVDRGEDSERALGLLDENWFYACRGNHEQILIDYSNCVCDWNYMKKVGAHWLSEKGGQWIDAMARKLDELPYFIVIGKDTPFRTNVLHAEFWGSDDDLDSDDLPDWTYQNMIWSRSLILEYDGYGDVLPDSVKWREGLSQTVVGHSKPASPFIAKSHLFLDTGSYEYPSKNLGQYTGWLSLFDPQRSVIVGIERETPISGWKSSRADKPRLATNSSRSFYA